MAYVSDLLGKSVTDLNGNQVGRVEDLLAVLRGDIPHPALVAVAIRRRGEILLIPMSDVAALVAPVIPLNKTVADLAPFTPTGAELYLARDVLDKQIIDVNGVRVVRVNDLELGRAGQQFYVVNVDIGTLGLLRRLGLAETVMKLARGFGRKIGPGSIAWHDVELFPGDHQMRLKVPGEKITELHPADLAEILTDLSRAEGNKLLAALDLPTLADTLEEVEPEFQASLIKAMTDERIADVLEEMAPDEAADLLAELPESRSRELLDLMGDEDADDVRRLLTYPEDTAGGIMTTEFAHVPADISAEAAIHQLRRTAHEAETIIYVFVTDREDRLLGVVSLDELVLSDPDRIIGGFMQRRVISVSPTTSQEEVAQAVAKYNLVAIPVVDERQRILGIVTADDALDKIIPTSWKKRLPRLYH